MSNQEQKLENIFFPSATKKIEEIREKKVRFVHYTNVDAAISILKNKEIWMRNASCMNDFMEVRYGLQCLYATYQNCLKKTLDELFPGLSDEIEILFDGWTPHFLEKTFLTCISEHDDREDDIGRLSMWRAYSDSTGVALIINNSVFFSGPDVLKIYSSPVAYLDASQFGDELIKVVENIKRESVYLKSLDRTIIKNRLFNMLKYSVLSTKHRGFKEEKEWRIIYSPTMDNSKYVKSELKVIRGIPQQIYKIPLQALPEENLIDIEIAALIDRIIIGPTQFSAVIRDTFIQVLIDAGVKDPDKKVYVSDIPLRR